MTVYTRRNVYSLDPNGPEIAAYRQGIKAMQARSSDDPTSWSFQTSIHGTPDPAPKPEWNQCQHGSYCFLSWHRMYVYWFERILRAASGDPNLTVPYWNYSDPTQRALPVAFREPGDPSNPNPLYIAERAPGINEGGQLYPSDVDFSRAFHFVNFLAPLGSSLCFGGQEVSEPGHSLVPPGQLERQPHNIVHDKVGGPDGLMSYPDLAARDPIFWLHHSNIDRLWKRWLDHEGGRANPTDELWLTREFTFFDEQGKRVTMAGKDILDTVNQLGYRYDDDPSNVPIPPFVHVVSTRAVAAVAGPAGFSTEVAATGGTNMIELGTQPVTVIVPMEDMARNRVAAMVAASVVRHRIVLNLEGIDYEKNPGVSYEVYINLPEGQEPDHQSEYYVGNLGFFGLKPHSHGGQAPPAQGQPGGNQSFDITGNVRLLQARGEWHGQVTVTLIMRGLLPPASAGTPPAKVQATAAAPPPAPVARIQRVTITTE